MAAWPVASGQTARNMPRNSSWTDIGAGVLNLDRRTELRTFVVEPGCHLSEVADFFQCAQPCDQQEDGEILEQMKAFHGLPYCV